MGYLVKTGAYCLVGVGYIIGLYGGVVYDTWRGFHGCSDGPCGIYDDTVLKSPNKPRFLVNQGYALEKRGQLNLALKSYQRAELLVIQEEPSAQRDKGHILILMNMSNVFIKAGQFEIAREILKNAMLTYPHFPGFAENIAVCYFRLGEPEKAIYFLEDGEKHFQDYPFFVNTTGYFLDEAIAYLQLNRCSDMHRTFVEKIWKEPDTVSLKEFPCKEKN